MEGALSASHALTIADFDTQWHDLRKKGWLHTDLFIYRSGNEHRVAATWVEKKWDDYATYYDMSSEDYEQKYHDFGKKGLRVTSFCAYRAGSAWRYSAIWEKVPGDWAHWYRMSADDYQKKYNEHAAAGFRVHQIQAYGDLFTAIWTKP
jgi:hypothetical protein